MRIENSLALYMNLPAPLLTAYVNTTQPNAARHPQQRFDVAWLEKSAAALIRNLSYHEAKQFHRQVERVLRFLSKRHSSEKALAFFAGPKAWKVVPLESPVENDLAWGTPKIEQLFSLLQGHRKHGVVVLDHKEARFFSYSRAALRLVDKRSFEVDASQWKRKDRGRIGSEGMQRSRGSERDLHARRIGAHYDRLCISVAREVEALVNQYEFASIFLVGPDRLIDTVRSKLARRYSALAVLVRDDLGHSSIKALDERIRPEIEKRDGELQCAAVNRLLNAEPGALTNPEEVISELQNGHLHTLVVAEGLHLVVRRCPACGLASAAADPVCDRCGSPRQTVLFMKLLPEILAARQTKLETVSGPAAEALLKVGGLGGWHRSAQVALAS